MPETDLERLLTGVQVGEPAAVAESLSRVEDTRPQALAGQRELLGALEDATPSGNMVVGLTGPPGVGKSTLASSLIRKWIEKDHSVGMVAVDPSSRSSGGALLGDRARLRFHPDERVFVRSMAARDRLGGLAPATRAAVTVLRAGFDWTLVETVGVGQSEIDIASVADTVVLVLQPGSGDALQFMKAGILEIPDVLVVHKWDLGELAQRTCSDLESILGAAPQEREDWTPPVLRVSAKTGEGIDELIRVLGDHRRFLLETGAVERRRAARRTDWVLDLLTQRFGAYGLERLGGLEVSRTLIEETPGCALDAFSELATRAGVER